MSEERKGGFGDKGGFGPKKPRATFGDVMLGIPAGRGGEKEGRGERRDDRRGERRGDRGDQRQGSRPDEQKAGGSPAAEAKPGEQGQRQERRDRRDRGGRGGQGGHKDRPSREQREQKPQGPLVVVRRASGTIETRPLEGTATGIRTEPKAEGAGAGDAGEPMAATPTPAPVPPPVVPRSSVADELPETESFAEMFEQQAKREGTAGRRQVKVGEKVAGKIFQLGADTAFVSLGGKSEAMVELRELQDEDGILRYGVGDEIEAHVVEAGARGIILSRKLSKGAASLAMLGEARLSGMPVEGLVLSVNKGGLEVAVGEVRAFCPASQVDIRSVPKLEEKIGERMLFRVMEVRERKVVLSRRALLEEEQKAKAAETRARLAQGVVARGKVTSVQTFGAFVDLGGVEGLIPVSEMSYVRVGHPSEVVKVGDDVEVEIIRMEAPNPSSPDKSKHKERITLSMRSRMEDPWKVALAELTEGSRVKGKIVRLQPFGAFVELRPGVDGLIHISALSERRIAHPRDVVQVGQEVHVEIEKIDPTEKRVGLRLISEDEASRPAEPRKPAEPTSDAPRPRVGQVVMGKVDRIEPYGVFVAFPGGRGLVPGAETGTERGTDLKRVFELGQELKVQVVDIDGSGKIKCSITAAQRAEERADIEAWSKTQSKGGGGKGFGTLGDLLKTKLSGG